MYRTIIAVKSQVVLKNNSLNRTYDGDGKAFTFLWSGIRNRGDPTCGDPLDISLNILKTLPFFHRMYQFYDHFMGRSRHAAFFGCADHGTTDSVDLGFPSGTQIGADGGDALR